MATQPVFELIVPENFIQSIRDSGYKSLGSALAELLDNAFEAKATQVTLTVERIIEANIPDVRVTIADNGRGMDSRTLRHALQFGWSSRFNQRDSSGRYGMGLPNASLSFARRIDVLSSTDGRTAAHTYLDVDEVVTGRAKGILAARGITIKDFRQLCPFRKGTVITWNKCDRLIDRKQGPLLRKLRAELGRLFRYQLWAGKEIHLNGVTVIPFDPLFEKEGANLVGATSFGPELSYQIEIPNLSPKKKTSLVQLRFVELPVSRWHSLSNEEKNTEGIAKNAGISIVRAGREIDRGWFFMGHKRKENYDDWWRCEVRFDPDLDEMFGVTHTKQEIHPSDQLSAILTPDMERIARDLNGRARRSFAEMKQDVSHRDSEKMAERFDNLIEPPASHANEKPAILQRPRKNGSVEGLEYRVKPLALKTSDLFEAELQGSRLMVLLNLTHPLVNSIYDQSRRRKILGPEQTLELMVLAAARAELTTAIKQRRTAKWTREFRRVWSNILAAYLS